LEELRNVQFETPGKIEAAGAFNGPFLLPIAHPPDTPGAEANHGEQKAQKNPSCGHEKANLVYKG
jgi:hypothetical protein